MPEQSASKRWWTIWTLVVTVGILIAAFAVWAIITLPAQSVPRLSKDQLSKMALSDKERFDIQSAETERQNEFRETLIHAFAPTAALLAAGIAWGQYRHQTNVARRQAAEKFDEHGLALFSEALKDIAAKEPEIRIGGIYVLAHLAEVAPVYRRSVAEVLSGFIRINSPWPLPPDSKRPAEGSRMDSQSQNLRTFAPDIQAALELIARHTCTWHNIENLRFRSSDLRRASLNGAHLEKAAFTESRLDGAQLKKARMDSVSLRDTSLQHAQLSGASLAGANIRGTDFSHTSLDTVTLTDATFDSTTKWPAGFTSDDAESKGAVREADDAPPTTAKKIAVPAV